MKGEHTPRRSHRRIWAPVMGIGLALVGCTTVRVVMPDGRTIVKTNEEFAEYVEQVFRHHNGVVNDLIVVSSLSGGADAQLDGEIIDAEEAMAAACQPLNEVVSAMVEGREPGFWTKLRLLDAVPACEASTLRVEVLIPTAF